MRIASVDTALYRIELPVPLSDSTHGTMTHFELVTVRLRDTDGAEGVTPPALVVRPCTR